MPESDPQQFHWHDELRKQYAAISPDSSVPVAVQLGRIWSAAVERTGDPALSVHLGQMFRPTFSRFSSLLMWSMTVGESLHQLARFWNPHAEAGRFSAVTLEEHATSLELRYRLQEAGNPPPLDAEFRLCRLVTYFRHISDPALSPVAVRFRHPAPAHRAALEEFFRSPVLFTQPVISLEFTRAALETPVLATSRQRGEIARLGEQVLVGAAQQGSLPDLLRETIRSHLADGDFAMKAIAPKLGMSPRTLQRRLQLRGTSFQELLDEARKEECMKCLQSDGGPYAQIATRLGYSNVANFHRAFRRWFGQTPNQMRRRLMEGGRAAELKVADAGAAEGPCHG